MGWLTKFTAWLTAQFNAILGWVGEQITGLFNWVWESLGNLVKGVIEALMSFIVLVLDTIPVPSWVSSVQSYWDLIPCDVGFWLDLAAVEAGLALLLAALGIRFLLRLIPGL